MTAAEAWQPFCQSPENGLMESKESRRVWLRFVAWADL